MLIRRAMGAVLPQSILWGRTRGLQAADASFRMKEHWPGLRSYCDTIDSGCASRFLDTNGMRRAIDRFRKNAPTLQELDDILRAHMLARFCSWRASLSSATH